MTGMTDMLGVTNDVVVVDDRLNCTPEHLPVIRPGGEDVTWSVLRPGLAAELKRSNRPEGPKNGGHGQFSEYCVADCCTERNASPVGPEDPRMSAVPNQQSRIDFRLQSKHKALIERAASVHGQTVTQFAIAALVKAAHESIQQASLTELSTRDRDVFLQMLDSNAAPNAALKKAAKRYRSRRART